MRGVQKLQSIYRLIDLHSRYQLAWFIKRYVQFVDFLICMYLTGIKLSIKETDAVDILTIQIILYLSH